MDYYNRRKIMLGCFKMSSHEKMTKNKKGRFLNECDTHRKEYGS
jgi:hypothetical protein